VLKEPVTPPPIRLKDGIVIDPAVLNVDADVAVSMLITVVTLSTFSALSTNNVFLFAVFIQLYALV
jgi:hypothetical protein